MKLFFYLTAFIALLFTACTKEKKAVEVNLPASTATLSRTFTYPRTNTNESANYTSNGDSVITKNSYYNSDGALLISFDVKYPVGNDGVSLLINKEDLEAGLIGDYVIAPFLTQGAPEGDVRLTYWYNKSASSSTFLLPGMASGELHITAFDEQKNLISGNFSFQINTNQDPKGGPVAVWEDTKIGVSGTFEHVQIK